VIVKLCLQHDSVTRVNWRQLILVTDTVAKSFRAERSVLHKRNHGATPRQKFIIQTSHSVHEVEVPVFATRGVHCIRPWWRGPAPVYHSSIDRPTSATRQYDCCRSVQAAVYRNGKRQRQRSQYQNGQDAGSREAARATAVRRIFLQTTAHE